MFGRGDRGTRRLQSRLPLEVDHHQRRARLLRPTGPLIPRTLVALAVIVLSAGMMSVGVAAMERDKREWMEQEARHAAPCSDPEVVWEGTTTGALETDLFEVSTGRFVVAFERPYPEPGEGMGPLLVSVEDENGREVSSGPAPLPRPGGPLMEDHHMEPTQGRYVVEVPPGAYKVSVDPGGWEKRYAVTVEECGAA